MTSWGPVVAFPGPASPDGVSASGDSSGGGNPPGGDWDTADLLVVTDAPAHPLGAGSSTINGIPDATVIGYGHAQIGPITNRDQSATSSAASPPRSSSREWRQDVQQLAVMNDGVQSVDRDFIQQEAASLQHASQFRSVPIGCLGEHHGHRDTAGWDAAGWDTTGRDAADIGHREVNRPRHGEPLLGNPGGGPGRREVADRHRHE